MKPVRSSAPPERNALRSRGCPNPDRAIGRSRPRRQLVAEKAQRDRTSRLMLAQQAMLAAQGEVRRLKGAGLPYADAAKSSRLARARYLALDGARPDGTVVQVADHSARWE